MTAGCHEQRTYSNPAKKKTPHRTLLSVKLKGSDDTPLVSIHLSNCLPVSSCQRKVGLTLKKNLRLLKRHLHAEFVI